MISAKKQVIKEKKYIDLKWLNYHIKKNEITLNLLDILDTQVTLSKNIEYM